MFFVASSFVAFFQTAETIATNGSELPLLSFIGFGVPVGGLISVLRTRHRTRE